MFAAATPLINHLRHSALPREECRVALPRWQWVFVPVLSL